MPQFLQRLSPKQKDVLKTVLQLLAEALALFVLFRFVICIAYVPSGSMEPTIQKSSVLFVNRLKSPQKVQRGDILLFQSEEYGITMVKRVIGLPGEHVEVTDNGTVFVDGTALTEPYVQNTSPISGEFEVPEDCFLFLGDNRANSEDARFWVEPYIPFDKLVGEALVTLWPFDRFGGL